MQGIWKSRNDEVRLEPNIMWSGSNLARITLLRPGDPLVQKEVFEQGDRVGAVKQKFVFGGASFGSFHRDDCLPRRTVRGTCCWFVAGL